MTPLVVRVYFIDKVAVLEWLSHEMRALNDNEKYKYEHTPLVHLYVYYF